MKIVIRENAELNLVESHLGGASLNSALFEFDIKPGAKLSRTVYQAAGKDQAQGVTATATLGGTAALDQTILALGAKVSRIETQLVHDGEGASAILNAAYLAGPGYHVDLTSVVRHADRACETRQIAKGAVRDGGRGVFQGRFVVPRIVGQQTSAEMQHQALLLEDGAEVFAKPELEIYADDVECAHGNTSGQLDETALFYMRQRGIPEAEARALLTEAFIAEAFEAADDMLAGPLLETARAWLKRRN